ncbi:TMV resistance protein N-like [Solanum stenotomum]|uniref:TMV resistance protein N-like n=1 Tax=Solanum stenotomum TaxID=172797 RepID=UPI0020D10992|nr:TMV resistance protein N-like [Solanum stenotomum]
MAEMEIVTLVQQVHSQLQLPSLRRLDLSHSKSLERTPDFEGMSNLEYLNLEGCRSLEEVHHSLKYCGKLIQLNLYECRRLKMFPSVNVESLESLDLHNCFSLEKFPEILGIMKPLSIIHLEPPLTELDLSFLKNLVPLPSSIDMLKSLVKLTQSGCFKFESLSKGIRYLEKLEELDASSYTLISQPPSFIIRLNKLKSLSFAKQKTGRGLVDGVFFVFLHLNELLHLESIFNLKYSNRKRNHFEDLPRTIAQVGSLQDLNLSVCRRFNEFLNLNMAEGFCSLKNLNLNYCNLEVLNLSGNNFEHLPQSIAQLGALRSLNLADCKSLTQLPEFPQQLYTINADWSNDSICNSLFQNISSLQHDISASDSLSLRVLWSLPQKIPSWFHHQGMAHLIPFCDDGMSSMTQEFALSSHSEYIGKYGMHFLLVTLGGLWDANGKTPNDYGCIQFYSEINYFGAKSEFGVRLLYKDDVELYTGIRKSRYEEVTGQLLLF